MKHLLLFLNLLLLLFVCCKKDEKDEPIDINTLRLYSESIYDDNGRITSKGQYSYYPDGTIKRIRQLTLPLSISDTLSNYRHLYYIDYIKGEDSIIVRLAAVEDGDSSELSTSTIYLNSEGLAEEIVSPNTANINHTYYTHSINRYDPSGHLVYTYTISYYDDSINEENVESLDVKTMEWENDNNTAIYYNHIYMPIADYKTYYTDRINTVGLTGMPFYGTYSKNPVNKTTSVYQHNQSERSWTYVYENDRIVRADHSKAMGYRLYEYVEIK